MDMPCVREIKQSFMAQNFTSIGHTAFTKVYPGPQQKTQKKQVHKSFFFLAQQSKWGQGRLALEVSISHRMTHHSR